MVGYRVPGYLTALTVIICRTSEKLDWHEAWEVRGCWWYRRWQCWRYSLGMWEVVGLGMGQRRGQRERLGSVSTVEFGETHLAVERTGVRACAKPSRIALRTLILQMSGVHLKMFVQTLKVVDQIVPNQMKFHYQEDVHLCCSTIVSMDALTYTIRPPRLKSVLSPRKQTWHHQLSWFDRVDGEFSWNSCRDCCRYYYNIRIIPWDSWVIYFGVFGVCHGIHHCVVFCLFLRSMLGWNQQGSK